MAALLKLILNCFSETAHFVDFRQAKIMGQLATFEQIKIGDHFSEFGQVKIEDHFAVFGQFKYSIG